MRIELNEADLSEAIGLLLMRRGMRGKAEIEMRCRGPRGKPIEFAALVNVTESETAEKEERR